MSGEKAPGLPLTLMNRDRFLRLFYEPVSHQVHAKTKLHLHTLRVDGGDFALAALYTELVNNSVAYVLSRQNMQRVADDLSRMAEFVNEVQGRFRKPDPAAGEGGELLLYSLLEAHLGAAKILSKMELKTSPQHYVHGTDGVHLLEIAANEYQLIFGESKMYGDAKERPGSSPRLGLKAAFASIGKVVEDNFEFDTWLVESELLKEALDPAKVEMLASILLPPASGAAPIAKSNAFGVFVGFELDVTTFPFADLTHGEIEAQLRQLAEEAIASEVDTIKDEIQNRGLGGHHFHIYSVPFLKRVVNGQVRGIEAVRMELAARLGGQKA